MFTTKYISGVCCTMFAACCLASCIDTEGFIGSLTEPKLPEGIKPSNEMTYGDLAEESCARFAAKYTISDKDFVYSNIELFGDGTYLFTKKEAQKLAQAPAVAHHDARGGVTLRIPANSLKAAESASNYYVEGGYEVYNDSCFIIDGVDTLFVKETVDNKYNLVFKNKATGRESTVYANKDAIKMNDATRSLCRTWNIKNWEQWVYLNSFLVQHSKYFGEVDGQYPYYTGDIMESGANIESLLQQECVTATFSPSGTYVCHFRNGTTSVRTWQWGNEDKGVLFFDYKVPGSESEEGYVTFRFKDNEARSYEDYRITLEDLEKKLSDLYGEDFILEWDEAAGTFESLRMLLVTTFQAVK